jgi:hypothetical protein
MLGDESLPGINSAARAELRSISREGNSEFFYHSLLSFGQRQEDLGNEALAARVYQLIQEKATSSGNIPLNIARRAQSRWSALREEGGSLGDHVEVSFRRFQKELPTALLTLGSGWLGFKALRLVTWNSLLRIPVANVFTRGLLPWAASILAGIGAEGSILTGIQHGLGQGSASWGKDLLANYRMMLGMRGVGEAFAMSARVLGIRQGVWRSLVHQAGTLGGMSLTQDLSPTQMLTTLGSFYLTRALAAGILGRPFALRERALEEMAWRSPVSRAAPWSRPEGTTLSRLAEAAGSAEMLAKSPRLASPRTALEVHRVYAKGPGESSGKGDNREVPGAAAKKAPAPVPVVDRFSRLTERRLMSFSTPFSSIAQSIEALLNGNPVRPLVIVWEGEGNYMTAVARARVHLNTRHGSKLIPKEFAVAFLFPGEARGWVIYPHGLTICSHAAEADLIRRLQNLEKANPPAPPPQTSTPEPRGIFQYQGRSYQIEGVPADAAFYEASSASSNPMAELFEAVRNHLRTSGSRSFVFSFGFNHAEPAELRTRLLPLLREEKLAPGPVIAVALVNDNTAHLFQKTGTLIQSSSSPIQMMKVEGSGSAGGRSSASSAADLPPAETVQQIFDRFKAALAKGRAPNVVYTGLNLNVDRVGPQFAQWLQLPLNRLPADQFAVIRMPKAVYAVTGNLGQQLIFSWHEENKVGWIVEGLPEEDATS